MRRLPVPEPGEPDKRSAARYLLWLVRNQKATIAMGMLFGTAWMVAQALVPAAVGHTIDVGITDRDSRELILWSLVVLGLGAVKAATGILRHRNALSNHLAAAYTTVQVVTRRAVLLGATLPKLVASGDVVAIGTSDISEIGSGLDISARLTGAVAAIIVVAVIMLWTSVPLGLIVLIGVPVLTGLTSLLLRPLHHRQRHYRKLQGELTGRAVDIATGLRVLRGIGGEPVFSARYRRESGELKDAAILVTRVESGLAASEVLLPGAIVAAVTFLAARFALDQRLTVGQLVAFYGYATFLSTPLRTLLEGADLITRGLVAAKRVVRVLNLEPEIEDPPGGGQTVKAAEARRGATLADASSGLLIPPGSFYAVACADPVDADTLALRITRFEDHGAPSLGGRPLNTYPVAELRSRILLARNSDQFFNATLRDELDSNSTADPERLAAAIHAACAEDIIEALPEGLETEVVDGGRTFSGGQLQRLRLVRALLREPEITVFVEPTSAVDAHTEARIARHLGELHEASDGVTADDLSEAARGTMSSAPISAASGVPISTAVGIMANPLSSTMTDSAVSLVTSPEISTQISAEISTEISAPSRSPRRTTVLFTTSPLLLDRAHRVAYVEDGRVAATGTHHELLAREGRYSAVVTRGENAEEDR